MARLVIYGRTSGDELDTGQDCQAQVDQGVDDAKRLGHEPVGVHMDDGVSGSVPMLERAGFAAAVAAVDAGQADAIAARSLDRIGRLHPVDMMVQLDELAARGVELVMLREAQLPELRKDVQDITAVGTLFFRCLGPYVQLQGIQMSTQAAMDAITSGARPTKSGRPAGRPSKVSREEALQSWTWAQEHGPAEAARMLSRQRGADEAKDERTRKKRRVGRTTLIDAWRRYGCVGNPDVSETVSVNRE